jgi:hypothetical protein
VTGGDGFTSGQRHLGAVPGKTDIAKIVHERLRALRPGPVTTATEPVSPLQRSKCAKSKFSREDGVLPLPLATLVEFKVNEARDHTLYASHTV